MQTSFTAEQLRDPATARSNAILRTCVHCGFCTATCPTYQVLGDELDSPRGRIYLIKDMLEAGRPADAQTVKHIDRCLSCLACMTTCPSGVHYMHLVDHARAYIERTYRRPPMERLLRWTLAKILPYPTRFRLALLAAKVGRPFAGLMPDPRLRAMLAMAPKEIPPVSRLDDPQVFPAEGARLKRVALMTGCAQRALNTDINAATIRLLTRLGCEVVIPERMGCCGALTHHMGRERESHAAAAANIRAFMGEVRGAGLDAIVINTSGCGTTVKDYGHMFEGDALAADAGVVAGLARDVSELLVELGLAEGRAVGLAAIEARVPAAIRPEEGKAQGYDALRTLAATAEAAATGSDVLEAPGFPTGPAVGSPVGGSGGGSGVRSGGRSGGLGVGRAGGLRVAYHAACSLQHGQAVRTQPKALLKAAGFEVAEPKDPHLCCGSAGTYNLMQPAISGELRARKVATLEAKAPDVIATGNIGCMMQIGSATGVPVVHTVELLDWATGGPKPRALAALP